jgi:hypothetical protein
LIDLPELQRRSGDIAARLHGLQAKRDSLAAERTALAHGNLLRRRITDFAHQVHDVIDQLDPAQRQQLLCTLIEEVHVTGWHVQIRLRIPLDPPDVDDTQHNAKPPGTSKPSRLSSQDRLRSLSGDDFGVVDEPVDHGGGDHVVAEDFAPAAEDFVAGDDQAGSFVAG